MRREAKVAGEGQVTIPQDIRRVLRVEEGDVVIFESDDSGVHLRPARPTSAFAEQEGMWREGVGLSVEEIIAQIRELRGHHE